MDVTGKQGSSDLALETGDTTAHGVDGQFEEFGRGPEASATHDFEKDSRRIPIGETAERDAAFFWRNAPFRFHTHTQTSVHARLSDYRAGYNQNAFGPRVLSCVLTDRSLRRGV